MTAHYEGIVLHAGGTGRDKSLAIYLGDPHGSSACALPD